VVPEESEELPAELLLSVEVPFVELDVLLVDLSIEAEPEPLEDFTL